MRSVQVKDLGTRDYLETWEYQKELFREVINMKLDNRDREGEANLPVPPNYFLFVEHPPVITLGKSGEQQHLLASEEVLKSKGIQFVPIDRGGDITYHGPGQIVGYPIIDLDQFQADIHKYMRSLEEVIIRTIAEYGLKGERIDGATGVWLDADIPGRTRKICAMGVRTSRWVTMHGFAINLNTNLDHFNYIIPCGLNDKQVTSMEKELKEIPTVEELKERIKFHFAEQFDARLTT